MIFQPKTDIIYLNSGSVEKGECRMKSSKQIAEEWGLSKITINDLCNKGKIPGAVKEGRKWLIQ